MGSIGPGRFEFSRILIVRLALWGMNSADLKKNKDIFKSSHALPSEKGDPKYKGNSTKSESEISPVCCLLNVFSVPKNATYL